MQIGEDMFEELESINTRPKPFEFYTASDLWTDEHTSKQLLSFHLNEEIDVSSRNAAFIERSVEWIVSHFNIGAGSKIADFGVARGCTPPNWLEDKQTLQESIFRSAPSNMHRRWPQ